MSTSIVMPQLGESVAEGIIGKWLKQEGEQVQKDEPIVEVITDKVNAEIPSPVSGTLERITQPEGATVAVGEEIALIGGGAAGADGSSEHRASAAAGSGVQQSVAPVPTEVERTVGAGEALQQQFTDVSVGASERPESGDRGPSNGSSNGRERVRSSPLVRRLAEQHGIDLATISGTGIGGRVSKQDIMAFVEQRQVVPAEAETVSAPPVEESREAARPSIVQPATIPHPTVAEPPAPRAAPPPAAEVPPAPAQPAAARQLGRGEELVPVSPLRKIIAQRMTQSMYTLPHATTLMEVDMTRVVRFREAHKDEFRRREGVPLSYVSFVIKATVEALKEHPIVNAEWAGDAIVMKHNININVAVDAPEGLTTPVIHNADERSLAGLSKAIYDLAMRARDKKLTVADMQGGTFTVNNTGTLGSVASVSIINYPQAGILTANAIVKRPVVVTQDGQDMFAVRSMMNLSFSFDHRLLDGGTAAGFVAAVKSKLESFPMDYPIY